VGGTESADELIPEPETIYERTKEEGKRRLQRPVLEEMSTALAAGFDIVAGVIVLALLSSQLEHHFGKHAAHVVGSLGFGIGFVFLIVGRGELFTENFLVPIAGLDDGDDDHAWLKLLKLWLISPFFGTSIVETAQTLHANGVLALFMSAVFAGALITAMTWFVEGQATMMPRVVVAWIVGAFLALGSLNHVIVVTIELIFGYRYGAHYSWLFILGNFGLAAAGNLVGGVGLVTLNRLTQGKAGNS
jgi:formate-nitrite transporter family protein